MKHVFKYLKMPVIFIENLEALKCYCQTMQRILKRDLVDLRQIGHYTFIVNTEVILHIPTVITPLNLHKQRRDKVYMLIPCKKGLNLPINILSIHHSFSKLHDLLSVVEMAIDAKWTVAMRKSVVMHLRKILSQLLSIFTVPHQFK